MNVPAPPTVFLVDDDREIRESLMVLLRPLERPVMAFENGESFYHFYDGTVPGCLILETHLPGRSGLDLYNDLIVEGKRLPVIFTTARAEVSTAVAAMKAGAIEFLEKPFDLQKLMERIRTAIAIDARWRENERRYHVLDQLIRHLNRTDQETLNLILRGETNKAMSSQLHITERAVELRRQRLMQRLEVRSLAELLDMTITHRVMEEYRVFPGRWREKF